MAKPKNIKPLSSQPDYIRMCVVAESGWGKTVFAGSAPKALFLTTDPEGTVSAKRQGSTADEWKIGSWDELSEAFIYLRDEGSDEYDWVIVDTITEAQTKAMKSSIDSGLKQNPGRDPLVPAQQDYQRSQNAVVQMVQKFHDLPMNVLWTAHRTDMENAEGEPYYGAAIHGGKGSLAQQILGYMSIVGYGEMKEVEGKQVRRMYFSHTAAGHRGKDRFAALGNYKDGLTVPKMLDIIAAPAATATPARRPVRRPVKPKGN